MYIECRTEWRGEDDEDMHTSSEYSITIIHKQQSTKMNEAGTRGQGVKSSLLSCDGPVLVVMGKVVEVKLRIGDGKRGGDAKVRGHLPLALPSSHPISYFLSPAPHRQTRHFHLCVITVRSSVIEKSISRGPSVKSIEGVK
ncbi:hypothetical protein LR48_Vigan04g042600 [Vigna angularis]|uniref:Uncharacterized protein n=1 Tax=Phaseolus angularis TaxID=3914 RepID=A0A0L9UBS8_PHAAN|nr:hypothetical protein LR48_Vigan04g042600 [Vigna angularis]